ncbi:MAG: tyrosine protein phosphatase [Thermoleophilaceae bacterium]|nr:tyrosine protein phosphatase [Thermoleophilaceae bacterium]
MIDLHSHILPRLDDGADDLLASLAMARAAAEDGVRTVVATPHVSPEYPTSPRSIESAAVRVNAALEREEIPLEVLTGAEIAPSQLFELDDDALRPLRLGEGPYLLVESPYTRAAGFLENQLFELQVRGFQVLMAHPERSPSLQGDLDRVQALVERGVLMSVTAGSALGLFGGTVLDHTRALIERGLVHVISSDGHDLRRRSPELTEGARAAATMAGDPAALEYWTESAPRSILDGAPVSAPPVAKPSGRLRGLLRRGS